MDSRNRHPGFPWHLLAVFALFAAGIVVVGDLYFENQRESWLNESRASLAAVADLKSKQITDWRQERLSDAGAIIENPILLPRFQQFLAAPASAGLAKDITGCMETWRKYDGYCAVYLLDAEGNPLLSSGDTPPQVSPLTRDMALAAAREGKAAFSDLHRHRSGQLCLSICTPVPAAQGGDGRPAGILVLKLDPYRFLFPVIQQWPTASPSAETLLVRREGDEVVYLNELRHRKDAALALRLPITQKDLPAAMGACGYKGPVNGVDYRGVPVVGVAQPVPKSPWVLVTKVDAEEINAPIRRQAWLVGTSVLGLVLAAGGGVGLFWRRRQVHFYRREHEQESVRRQTEEALQKSEKLYRSLFENLLNGFAYCRMLYEDGKPCDFVYLAVNGAFESQTGLKDVVGKRATEVIPGIREADPRLFDAYGRVARTGRPERFEVFVEALQMWFSISVYSPAPEHFVAVFDVITERKRAEEALRLAHERLRCFVDANIVGVLVADAAGAVLEANDYYLRLIGYTREELARGKVDWRALTPPEWLPTDERAIRELRERGVCTPYEKEYLRRDGTRVPVFLADAMLPGPGEQIAAFALDITDRKRAEEQLRKANESLEQRVAERTRELAQTNEELESFSYSVSHDLKAPVRAIDGFARILVDEHAAALPEEIRRYLGLILKNSRHMGQLINDLLAFSHLSRLPLNKQTTSPARLAHEALEALKPEQNGRRLEVTVDDLPPCQGDPALLRQVFANLLANALKFTRRRDVAVIRVGCRQEAGRPVYFIADNGVGFDMQYADKLFGVFQRLHRAEDYEGTGVGLAIVQRVVRRHGGDAWAEAQVDKGATFYFTLEGGCNHE